ncbi:protein tiptop [Bacillus rossius redtenbacheri]|uniref:protein tiptop n=1 Tax=Bacillus rossius redtenbacheri TaxID=93214 RepID=UPI002FDE6D4C
MPRRKQDCPKRMKWEGGEEGAAAEGDASADSPGEDAASSAASESSPPPPPLPVSPASSAPGLEAEPPASALHDPLLLREGSGSRCPSRDSRGSSLPRCPSRDSQCSERGLPKVALPAVSPVTALLPPHTAALAAYLGHHSRLLMTSPLPPLLQRLPGPVSPLVTSSSSPPLLPLAVPASPDRDAPGAALDFSTRPRAAPHPEHDAEAALNLSKPATPVLPPADAHLNSPLDLSLAGSRKRGLEASSPQPLSPQHHHQHHHLLTPPARKSSRASAPPTDFKPVVSPWTSPVVASHFPYFAAAVAAASSLSPKSNGSPVDTSLWNGKLKMPPMDAKSPAAPAPSAHFAGVPTPSDATKALEKMSELSKLGGEDLFRPANSGNRHSAWQSHWLNKGAEQAKDVLKCVWCKQSFPSLAAMTTHMKEAKHCGVSVPAPPPPPPPPPPQHQPPPPPTTAQSGGAQSGGGGKPTAADLNLLIKETMPLPRKLVRGQDVWLGKGAEQTRQILKCMWCGQSFRSLAEMTSHMQQTQHYTNIISQEQIISWKSADDNGKAGPGAAGGGGGSVPGAGGPAAGGGASSHVSAVLTCKVCDQAFSSLKELSNHMVKNSHYKEHIMRSITESGGRRRQTREKRKKSLPVRKLLELERAQHELKNGEGAMIVGGKISRDHHTSASTGRITCEKCGEKIETSIFVDHIRQCVGGGTLGGSQRNLLKNALLSSNIIPPDSPMDGRKSSSLCEEPVPPTTPRHHRSPNMATDLSAKDGPPTTPGSDTAPSSSSPSVLNAIEKLIEKSFDSRARHGAGGFGAGPAGTAPIGSSILKRLGIDESVDYTKPLVDPQTMNLLRSYHHHHHQQHHFRRERSGSESSSVSDRGLGRGEVLTPDRKPDPSPEQRHGTPRTTPDKGLMSPPKLEEPMDEDRIKKEPVTDDEREDPRKNTRREVIVKKEEVEEEEDDRASFHSGGGRPRRAEDVPLTPASAAGDEDADDGRGSRGSAGTASPRRHTPLADQQVVGAGSPCRTSTGSPAGSDRSSGADKKPSSLGALSSMFDSLSGGGGQGSSADGGAPGSSSGGRASSSHPLAALQKLCDKTERHGGGRSSAAAASGSSGGHASSSSSQAGGPAPGAILAFSWACNDAVVTADSIMKCAFCDTPFISKGAYRHHLSKMHFVKDGMIPDTMALKSQQQGGGGGSGASPKASNSVSGNGGGGSVGGSSSKSPQQQPPPQATNFEESPHSKFLKYTELAKQLSSKYV